MAGKRKPEMTRKDLRAHNRWMVEWVIEPVNADGDIIDPQHFEREPLRGDILNVLAGHSDAMHADVAKCRRLGSEAEGEVDREYSYRTRTYRDGQVQRLTPEGNLA